MNKTANYQLNQWEKTDKVLMDDFNADNAKIDGALKSLATQVGRKAEQSALQAEVNARTAAIASLSQTRNCQAVIITYTGTGAAGQDHPNTITFDRKPLFIHVGGGDEGSGFSAVRGQNVTTCHRSETARYITFTWSGNKVSWYEGAYGHPLYQMNVSGKTYYLFAVLEL